jgi:chromosome partitioning protein
MAKVITLAHQKGGVGKSTLTLNLAYSFKEYVNTAIVDLDPQGTISQLSSLIKNLDVVTVSSLLELKLLPYDVVFVDTPPYLSADLPELFRLSDLIIIPTKAGLADLLAIRATIKMLEYTARTKQAYILFNMVKHRTSLTREINDMLKEYAIPVLKTLITDRVSYSRSLIIEKGVMGLEDEKARQELQNLVGEILKAVNK